MIFKDEPIQPLPDFPNVIDFEGLRIARGKAAETCNHRRLTFCEEERRVWCQDCGRTVEPFDLFMAWMGWYEEVKKQADKMHRKATALLEDAAKRTLLHRAAKQLSSSWRKGAVGCPHCRGMLLPEDFEKPLSYCSREYVLAARAKAKKS